MFITFLTYSKGSNAITQKVLRHILKISGRFELFTPGWCMLRERIQSPQKSEIAISAFRDDLRSPEAEKGHFFRWSVCLSVCVCVNTISQILLIRSGSNLKYILLLVIGRHTKLFIKVRSNVQGVY